MVAPKTPLKDQLFNRAKVTQIASEINEVDSGFDEHSFIEEVMSELPELELKQRISWIATCLGEHLPGDYRRAASLLVEALPAPLDPSLTDGDFGEFIYATYGEYVARHGCTEADYDVSMATLREITTRFSAEFAIRPFLDLFPDATVEMLLEWTQDPHYHVRRLCSEGTRPRLPWATRLKLSPERAIPLLDSLYTDPTRCVTRSVANHVNDLTKIDPELALNTLARWRDSGRQGAPEMEYIVRHATRSLVRSGHARAEALRR